MANGEVGKPLFLQFAERLYAENLVLKRMLFEHDPNYAAELNRRLATPLIQGVVRKEFDKLYAAIRHDRALRTALEELGDKMPPEQQN